jgi:metal-sulfur cluster biosynthetic enzyme
MAKKHVERKNKEEKKISQLNKDAVLKELKEVIDPEIGLSIVDMNLIKDVKISGKDVFIKMTLTTPFCPLASFIVESVKEKVKSIKGVGKVEVEVVF